MTTPTHVSQMGNVVVVVVTYPYLYALGNWVDLHIRLFRTILVESQPTLLDIDYSVIKEYCCL